MTELDPAVAVDGIEIEGASWTSIRSVVRTLVDRIDTLLDEDTVIVVEEGPKLERHDGLIVWAKGKTSAHELRYGDHVLWIDNEPHYVVHPGGVEEIAKLILAELNRS